MKIDRNTAMPEKWRNRFFKYVAGGDRLAGNLWHVAFVLIDEEGHLYWVGNDGAGKIEDLAETLEQEFVRHEDVSWDHEFQEHDVSTKEAVTQLCKDLARMYEEDVCVQASVANMLYLAGYDGAGCVCSDCGEFFETTDYLYDVEDGGGFSYCIDHEAYHGCGGFAVSFTRIVCDECRSTSECPVCCDMNNPTTKDLKDKDYWKEQDFDKKFAYDELGICEFCWERFQRGHDGYYNSVTQEYEFREFASKDMERLPNDIKVSEVLKELKATQERKSERWDESFLDGMRKYAKWQTDEGMSRADVEAALVRQMLIPTDDDVNYLMKIPSAFAYGAVRNVLIPLALKYFGYQLDHIEFKPTDLTEFWKEVFNG